MFSYRHAFHAGNHADVLKHSVLIAVTQYMTEKPVALNVIDTHAGAGLYRLDSEHALLSGEIKEGFQLLQQAAKTHAPPPMIAQYLETVALFNPAKSAAIYPGSPFIVQRMLGDRDKLKLFELHPTDARLLEGHVKQLEAGRQVAVIREDGFESLKKLLPPPSKRALVLMDPSYEIKTDYAKVSASIQDALRRFATGTYMVWYPLIARPEAHDLPKRLRTLANQAGRPWLHLSLTTKSAKFTPLPHQLLDGAKQERPGLPGSGVFLINPPYTLKALAEESLPYLKEHLGQDSHAQFHIEHGGS